MQRIIKESSPMLFEDSLNYAIRDGYTIQSIVHGSGVWFAIIYKL